MKREQIYAEPNPPLDARRTTLGTGETEAGGETERERVVVVSAKSGDGLEIFVSPVSGRICFGWTEPHHATPMTRKQAGAAVEILKMMNPDIVGDLSIEEAY